MQFPHHGIEYMVQKFATNPTGFAEAALRYVNHERKGFDQTWSDNLLMDLFIDRPFLLSLTLEVRK